MAEGVNVGTLVRQNYEKPEEQKWDRSIVELTPCLEADVSEFKEVFSQDVVSIIEYSNHHEIY